MKKLILLLLLTSFFFGTKLEAQQFIILKAGQNTQINGFTASYIAALKKTKKGVDYYRVTVSITNMGSDFLQLFSQASRTFVKTDHNALAYFQFVNATGRGLSATSGKLYAHPLTMPVPYKCRKCPPPADSKKDPYNHYVVSYYIGLQFRNGATISRTYDIRVSEGTKPVVRVIIQ